MLTTIGDYTLVEQIGNGASATVYRCEDKHMQEWAMKIVQAKNKTLKQVVRREKRMFKKIDHDLIISCHEYFSKNNTHFFITPLYKGVNLTSLLPEDLDEANWVVIFSHVAEALDYLHAKNIVHRDVKPDNIILTPDGAILIDLGLAVEYGWSASKKRVFGTPRFMSPEQCRRYVKLDGRSDIFSLGCTMYTCLTGLPPIPLNIDFIDDHAVFSMYLHEVCPKCPTEFGVNPILAMIIMKCIAKKPEDRFQSANELLSALHQYISPDYIILWRRNYGFL